MVLLFNGLLRTAKLGEKTSGMLSVEVTDAAGFEVLVACVPALPADSRQQIRGVLQFYFPRILSNT